MNRKGILTYLGDADFFSKAFRPQDYIIILKETDWKATFFLSCGIKAGQTLTKTYPV